MKLDEIKTAVDAGRTVHWATDNYDVIHDLTRGCDQWLIRSKCNDHYIGLTHRDGVTMNGREDEFYLATPSSDEVWAEIERGLRDRASS